jgi:tetratricopeptide (TPR) repeat protein
MRLKVSFVCLLFFVIFSAFFPGSAQSLSPQESLRQYIADLQKNPGDAAVREKIIKLVLALNLKPAISQDAVMHEGAAEYAIKHAKTTADFTDAAKEYEQALLAVPWSAQDYFNCGVAYEKAEQYDAAVRNFNLYLVAAPGAKDANDVLKRIGGLEYAAKKAAQGPSPESAASSEQNGPEDWIKKLDGRRYTCQISPGILEIIDVKGKILVVGDIISQESGAPAQDYQELNANSRFEIRGRESVYPLAPPNPPVTQFWAVEESFKISEDGESITQHFRFNDGDTREYIFLWQR